MAKWAVWLKQNSNSWPEQTKLVDEGDIFLMTNTTEKIIGWSRFSKNQKMINVVVCSHIIQSKQSGVVTAFKKQNARLLILQLTRKNSFAEFLFELEINIRERKRRTIFLIY